MKIGRTMQNQGNNRKIGIMRGTRTQILSTEILDFMIKSTRHNLIGQLLYNNLL
jgi:hypothetical protein